MNNNLHFQEKDQKPRRPHGPEKPGWLKYQSTKSSYVVPAIITVCGLILASVIICLFAFTYSPQPKELITYTNKIINDVHNNVTNEITNKVVSYEDLTITDVDQALVEAIKKVENQVVGITVRGDVDSEYGIGETNIGLASGIIYKREEVRQNGELVNYKYYCLTNAHVVNLDGYDLSFEVLKLRVYVYFGYEDEEIEAEVLGFDSKSDIAAMVFYSGKYIEPIKIADSSKLQKGQLVFAIGNPNSYDYFGSATFGMVSSPLRYISTDTDNDGVTDFYAEYIQHDVAINAGNSGGGLFTLNGELVGINSMKLVSREIENMSFSVPTNTAMKIINDYIEPNKEIIRAKLNIFGYEIRSLTELQIKANDDIKIIPNIYGDQKPFGIYIIKVDEGVIAKSEIDVNDIILEVNDIEITRTYILTAKLNSLTEGFMIGDELKIKYYDYTEERIKTVYVTLE